MPIRLTNDIHRVLMALIKEDVNVSEVDMLTVCDLVPSARELVTSETKIETKNRIREE